MYFILIVLLILFLTLLILFTRNKPKNIGDLRKKKRLHLNTEKQAKELRRIKMYNTFLEALTKLSMNDFKNYLLRAKKDTDGTLRNTEINKLRSLRNNEHKTVGDDLTINNLLDYLNNAKIVLEKRIKNSLQSICEETGMKPFCYRSKRDQKILLRKWAKLSSIDQMKTLRPVYVPNDFLEALFLEHDPIYRILSFRVDMMMREFTYWTLKVKTLPELRHLYKDLATADLQFESYTTAMVSTSLRERERMASLEKNLEQPFACQELLKIGAPYNLRSRMWSQVLGFKVTQSVFEEQYFSELVQKVLLYDIIIDKLVMNDVKTTTCNYENYFVYRNLLYQVMLCFTRDAEVKFRFGSRLNTMFNDWSTENAMNHSNGFVPFYGFSLYAAPVCYLYKDPVRIYFTFRAFYQRYWFRLHEISTHPQSILGLCILFQRLLQAHESEVWSHLMSYKIHPVRVVFKWLMQGFSGYLPPDQLLKLWDMILAYNSLEVLPLLAVGILSFKRNKLLQVNTLQNVNFILDNMSSLNVTFLLQLALKDPLKMD